MSDNAVFLGQSEKREELFLAMANRHGLSPAPPAPAKPRLCKSWQKASARPAFLSSWQT
jgi:hypothetical protein